MAESAYDELRKIAESVRRGADSLFSSLPFAAPESMGFQINAKIAGPLTELREWLDAHPRDADA